MTEYGIFSDEGCVEAGFWTREAAETAARDRYADDDVTVHAICTEHEEQPADACEGCDSEEDEA